MTRLAAGAAADEAAVRRLINSKLRPGDKLESVQKASYGDLYEVTLRTAEGPFIYYVDSGATVIIVGNVIDARTGQDLTEALHRYLTAIKWETPPLDSAVTTVRGNGRRKIAVFSDPNCPFCKRFEATLDKIDDNTVYIFLYPVIKPESVPLTKSVWCSKDRAKAWNDLMLRGVRPQASPDCDTPVEKLVEVGRRLGATSTPTWILASGGRYKGALPLEQIRVLLDRASPRRRAPREVVPPTRDTRSALADTSARYFRYRALSSPASKPLRTSNSSRRPNPPGRRTWGRIGRRLVAPRLALRAAAAIERKRRRGLRSPEPRRL